MEVAIGREKSFRAPQDMSWESRDGLGQGSWFPAALSRCGLVLGDGADFALMPYWVRTGLWKYVVG